MDALGELQAQNNVEEMLEIEVLDADENINVYKEQIPYEKTNYMLPQRYAANVEKYVLSYENAPSTAEDSVFDIQDADFSFDADANHSYFSN